MSLLLVVRYPEEGRGLLGWARRVASALGLPFEVVVCDPEAGPEIKWRKEGDEPPEFLQGEKIRWGRVQVKTALEETKRHVKEAGVTYVLTGKRNSGGGADNNPERRLARRLFEELPCAVIVMRLPDKSSITVGDILIPAAGGSHSRVSLQLASKMAGDHATALFVEPDVDEVSREVGNRRLLDILRRVKVDPASMTSKVVLGRDVAQEIGKEAESGKYELILIGASDSRTLRSKLFGTVPDRLLRGPGGLGVGVVRGPLPTGRRLKEAFGEVLRLRIPQLEREERIELVKEIQVKSTWSFDFAFLMILATFIAALGLLLDSGAVVIGAMLVAPLMTPLIGAGLAMVQGNWPLWRRSWRSVLLGFFFALGIALVVGLVARWNEMELTGQLRERGEFSGLGVGLNVGVAFAAGVAASFCMARPHLSGALAGVAIAAALVPPIATVGISLALGEFVNMRGASLLFGTNVVAIVVGAGGNFFAAGIRPGAGRGRDDPSPEKDLATSMRESLESLEGELADYRFVSVGSHFRGGVTEIELELAGPQVFPGEQLEVLKEAARDHVNPTGKIRLRVRTLLETTEEPS